MNHKKKEKEDVILFPIFLLLLLGSIVMFIIGSLNTSYLIFGGLIPIDWCNFNIPIWGSTLMFVIGIMLMLIFTQFLIYLDTKQMELENKRLKKWRRGKTNYKGGGEI